MRKLSRNDELYVIGIVFDNPTMYIDEICHEVFDATGITVSASTICHLLKAYGITRKKVQFVAIQRSATLRGAFMAHCHMFSTDKFIWVDETGTDRRDQLRKHTYSLRGTTPFRHTFIARGIRVNAIAAMCHDGIVSIELTNSTVNHEIFFDFVRSKLIPAL